MNSFVGHTAIVAILACVVGVLAGPIFEVVWLAKACAFIAVISVATLGITAICWHPK